jgi:hypothetical protein
VPSQSDHEKYIQRAKDVQAVVSEDGPVVSSTDAAALYKKQDLSLKEGETLKFVLNC